MSRYNGGSVKMDDIAEKLQSEAGWKSKYTPARGEWEVVYGFDHACGYFLQLFPVDVDAKVIVTKMTGEENGCIDIDSLFSGFSGLQLGYFLKINKINFQYEDMCFLDMPF